jgi:serine/threonine-protein kinase RsbW
VAQSIFLAEIEFQLSGTLSELERLASEVGKFCAVQGLEDEVGFELNLVLEELFTNSIRHGGCEGMERAVSIALRAAEGREVMVTYADRGRPFNPLDAAPAQVDLPLADRVPGGLGIHLVRRIMKDLEYDRLGEWNRLTMRLGAQEGTCCS